MPIGRLYWIRQHNETQSSYGATGYLNTSISMISLLETVGEKILLREAGHTRDQAYAYAKKYGRRISINKVSLIVDEKLFGMLEITLMEIDKNAKLASTGAFAIPEESVSR